jgi:hypothetical protein
VERREPEGEASGAAEDADSAHSTAIVVIRLTLARDAAPKGASERTIN